MKRQNGFTLLEMMVSLALLAIISLTGYQILQSVVRNDQITQQHATRLAGVQRMLILFEQDLVNAIVRPPKSSQVDNIPEFVSGHVGIDSESGSLLLTRTNWINPSAYLARSQLQRVGWRIYQQSLERINYQHPDSYGLVEPQITAHFDEVTELQLRFYQRGRWQDQWANNTLPEAIEITFIVAGYGKLQRTIFIMATP
ncbi:type II secretion system minor pseudopilin GspJ [Yersinia enterocolitica]|uniref:type II secretion system minor pseudopilin GspJ n=1 Tax=Yersinia enterocolitica TaxID=630 RepID=UPI00398D4553